MNIPLSLMNIFTPNTLKKEKLRELFNVTAEAFQIPPPTLSNLKFNELLHAFAEFTLDAAIRQMSKNEDISQVKRRLYDGAFRIGKNIRSELRIHSLKDALKSAGLLYRAIGIDFHCDESGQVAIRRCYFSSFYSCEVCWIISSLDEGLIAGLTDGGRLWFVSRITEGSDSCVGTIEFETSTVPTPERRETTFN